MAQWTGVEPADLVVVSERAAVDRVAPWQIVDQRDAVAERVRYWRGNGRRAVIVIELQGPRDLDRVARHLAVAGADLTRLVVGDLDHPGELADTLRAIGPVAALDIARPPDPSALLQLVENGVRVATVCGRQVTAELMAGVAASARG